MCFWEVPPRGGYLILLRCIFLAIITRHLPLLRREKKEERKENEKKKYSLIDASMMSYLQL